MSRNKYHTEWAGAFAVASELSRRGFDVAITVGQSPTYDLLCNSSLGVAFKVQVKSLTKPNAVPIQKRIRELMPRNDLFFVVALVPEILDDHPRYFVLTHAEVIQIWQEQPKINPRTGKSYRAGWEGLLWKSITPHENKWDKLPK